MPLLNVFKSSALRSFNELRDFTKIKNKLLGILFCLALYSLPMQADECPAIPSVPVTEYLAARDTLSSVARPFSVTDTGVSIDEVPLGIGYLRVLDIDNHFYDWPVDILLPLWSSPNESEFMGWIQNGDVISVASEETYTLTGAGMVETDYEQISFIVYEDTGNGWLRIRLRPGKSGDRWIHQCYLKLGTVGLKYEMWQSFLWEHSTWLHFRAPVTHVLRNATDINSQQVTMIGLDHKLELVEFNGDWMYVKVQQPDTTCSSDSESRDASNNHEGWVKWRDADKGTWIWIYSRGC